MHNLDKQKTAQIRQTLGTIIMDMYVYADETSFSKDNDSAFQTIGTGVLISDHPIDDKIIADALTNLINDPEINKDDQKTIKNGFFHASMDTKNGHSHLCTAINKNVRGIFKCSYFNKEKLNPFETQRTNEDLNRLTLGLSSLDIHTYKCEKIHLYIENRNGFSEDNAKKWIENWLKEIDKHAYTQTSYITYYPKIEVHLCPKKTAGLQVVDFILWAFNRSNKNPPDESWLDKIQYNFIAKHSSPDWPQDGGEMFIGNGADFQDTLYEYPIKIEELSHPKDFYDSWDLIAKTINSLNKNTLPENIQHLNDKISLAYKTLNNSGLTETDTKHLASTFIRVFDTLPLYKNLTASDYSMWTSLLKAKKLAGLLLRPELHEYSTAYERVKWHADKK